MIRCYNFFETGDDDMRFWRWKIVGSGDGGGCGVGVGNGRSGWM